MSTALRTNDPGFMVPVERWINRLAQETAQLQISRGGPVIITQVENEYGSFVKQDTAPPDPTHAYMTHMRDIFLRAGYTGSLLDTVDEQEPERIQCVMVSDQLTGHASNLRKIGRLVK